MILEIQFGPQTDSSPSHTSHFNLAVRYKIKVDSPFIATKLKNLITFYFFVTTAGSFSVFACRNWKAQTKFHIQVAIKLAPHIHRQLAFWCPHGYRTATAIFICQYFSTAFHSSPSTWADSQWLGVAATTTVLCDSSRNYFCGSRWRNLQRMIKF